MTGPASKPPLPKRFLKKSNLGAVLFMSFATTMWIVPASAAYWLASETHLAWGVTLVLLLPCALLAGQGLHLLGWVGHEGFHFNLHTNRAVSAVLGLFFSSMILSFMQVGASISHKTHHAHTNKQGDPDIAIFAQFRSFWSRLFFARAKCNRIYLRNTIRLLRRGSFPEYWAKPPFRWPMMRRLAMTNVIFSATFAALYAFIAWHEPIAALASIAAPHLIGVLYTGLRSYVEHADTSPGEFVDSRTRTAPFFTFWYYFNNYHMEHHLYPSVPCYRLRQVHLWLFQNNRLNSQQLPIENTVLGAYSYTLARHRYPQPVDL